MDFRAQASCRLNPNFRLDNFVQGSSNVFAKTTALKVAKNPGNVHNPLLFYGGVGLGKTHLMHGIGHYLLEHDQRIKIAYLHSERFVAEMVKALQNNVINDFKQYYRSIDVLLIDDIQFFSGKGRSQEALFYVLNWLMENRQQIILTSDRFPKFLSGIEDRLRSRFVSGLTVSIDPPNYETRLEILCNKVHDFGIQLPRQVLELMAKRLSTNVRELEAALKHVVAKIDLKTRGASSQEVMAVLKGFLGDADLRVSINAVLKIVAEFYGLSVKDLLSAKRNRALVRPRQMAMALCKELTESSLVDIGNAFGGRDHSTVLHACRQIHSLKHAENQISADFNQLTAKLIEAT